MRIAQVAPVAESVPPKLYGGVERVVSYLTEELVSLGHDVTLFASGDSRTTARLQAIRHKALRLDDPHADYLPYHVLAIDLVLQQAASFDVLHFHTDPLHFPASRFISTPILTTLHGRLDLADLNGLYRLFRHLPMVSISHAQRDPMPYLNWLATVHHGIPINMYSLETSRDDYIAFVGRICPEKRPDRAIRIAQKAGINLKIAAKVDRVDRDYFEAKVRPLLNCSIVEFVGEIGDKEKGLLLGKAQALVCSGDWPEPFGLASIEAMACGTPVITFPHGANPEVVDHGVTGFVIEDVASAARAVIQAPTLSRPQIRREFEQRFTAHRMARDYLTLYHRLHQASDLLGKSELDFGCSPESDAA